MKATSRPQHRKIRRNSRKLQKLTREIGSRITVEEATERISNGAIVYARFAIFLPDGGRRVDLCIDQVTDLLDEEVGERETLFNIDLDGDLLLQIHPG